MATDLCEGIFNKILIKKRMKMTKNSDSYQSFIMTAKALELLGIILRFM